jgi:hypothetical protein
VTTEFPILSAGPTPQIKVENWTLALQLGSSLIGRWNWAEFEALPQTAMRTDIHCVTKWSKLDTDWQGVTFDDLLKAVGVPRTLAPYIMAHCDGGYATNVPVADLVCGGGMIATRYGDAAVLVLDGNAAAGLLQEIFVPDITIAEIQCETCIAGVGSLSLYAAQMGAVLRCGHRDNVLMMAVNTPHGCWLEMMGTHF